MATKKIDGKGGMEKGRDLEVRHLAETTDLSPKQARDPLAQARWRLAKSS